MHKQKWFYLVFSYLALFCFSAGAQDTLRGEKGFLAARKLAFSGKRQEARALLYHVLASDSDYADAEILLARTYSWDGKYDSARIILKKVVKASPKYKDPLDALIDVELWSDHPADALNYANTGLKIDPVYEDFMVKKVRAMGKLGHAEQAARAADSFAKASHNSRMVEMANTLKRAFFKNSLVFTSDVDIFSSTFDPWYYSSISYGQKTRFLGTLIGRVNYAHRFDENGWQIESDAYPSLGKKMYAYLNAGYSPSSIFPLARGGVSLYYNLPKAFEAELGARYLYFSSSTFIYTGSVGKYYKDFWFSLRTFVTPGSTGISNSYYFITRYYLADADNYITLQLGSGVSPDERATDVVFFNPADQLLSSRSIKVDFYKSLSKDYYIGARASYSYDEVTQGVFRQNPSFGITLEKRF